MDLRPALASDAQSIARLHAESWRTAYRGIYRDEYLDGDVVEERTTVWAQRFASPAENQFVTLATEGDDLLGFVCAYGDVDARWGTLVDNLHVRLDQQGRGIGRCLLAAAATWSRERYPAAPLHLWVLDANAKARRFYERLGAQPQESALSEPPGGGSVTGWRYAWRTRTERASDARTVGHRGHAQEPVGHRHLLRRRDQLSHEVERSLRYGAPISLVLMDMDNFKELNDRFGHFMGDRFLGLVGEAIARQIRSSDVGARYFSVDSLLAQAAR